MFKIDAAKEAGYSNAEIASFLAQQRGFDLAKAKEAGYSDSEIADYLAIGREMSAGEAFARTVERTATSFIRGGADLLKRMGIDTSAKTEVPESADPTLDWMNGTPMSAQATSNVAPGERQLTDIEKEQEARIAFRQQTEASIGGLVVGAAVDPTNLIGIGTKTALQGALKLGAFSAGQGAVEPVYEEFGDSRLRNTAISGAIGAGLGAIVGKLSSKAAAKANEVIDDLPKVEPDASVVTKTREEIEAELPPLTKSEQQAVLLSRLPEEDQAIIDKVLSRYEDVDVLPPKAFTEIADAVEPTNPQVAALFRSAQKEADPVAETQAALLKADFESKAALKSATVEATDNIAEASSWTRAERTGDYRDWLRDPTARNAPLNPMQIAKMIDVNNPYSNEHMKLLLSRDANIQNALKQLEGPIYGRVQFDRQGVKAWNEIEAAGETIPEEIAVQAFLNKKVEEVLPPEVTSKMMKVLARNLSDLNNMQDLARLAKETNNEEAYAMIMSKFTDLSSLVAAAEGNASNLGRALAYQKRLKDYIDKNVQLPPYLGGLSC